MEVGEEEEKMLAVGERSGVKKMRKTRKRVQRKSPANHRKEKKRTITLARSPLALKGMFTEKTLF